MLHPTFITHEMQPQPPVVASPPTSPPAMITTLLLCLAAGAAGCGKPRDPAVVASASAAPAPPTTQGAPAAGTAVGGAAEWATQGKDLALTRYSDLRQITTGNVKDLKLAWSFATGVVGGHEGTPLVVGSTMYLVAPFPNVAYALDLTREGAIKWQYHPNPDPWAIGVACCGPLTRGWAYADGKLIYNLLDDRTIAVDAKTGQLVWQTKLGDATNGETMTMAPFVVRGNVFVGNSGGEMNVRGWIAALDVKTGKLVWRAYSTGPDKDVRIGADFKPFYARDRGADLGRKTWPGDAWRHGGGTVWAWISYDPGLDLLYYGTGNPSPWNTDEIRGDGKWGSTIFARDPDTGAAKWALQTTPRDGWDYDAVNENILVDLPMHGPGSPARKVMAHFDRNGYGYTIDRATGEVLVAKPFSVMTWSDRFDLATALPHVVESKRMHEDVNVRNICPAQVGGKNHQPAAFSPRTGLFYVPVNNMCMDEQGLATNYIPGTPNRGARTKSYAGPGGNQGEFIAWDAAAGRRVWQIEESLIVTSGALATAGDVVFYGTVEGYFKAVDARTGALLWQTKLGSGVGGPPMTYVGPDGKQYVAVITGAGGVLANNSKGKPGFPPAGGTLYVFSL